MRGIGNKEILAKNLRYYIELSGKTQVQIAEIVGVAQSTFNDWATAKKYPRIDKIEILANYFGVQKSDLIEEKTKDENPAADAGISEKQKALIDFAKSVPENQIDMILRVMRSIVGDEK